MANYVVGAVLIVAGVVTENPQLIAMGVAMLASAVISKAFANENQPNIDGSGYSQNPGNRQQLPPATDNKLPVVYGSAYVGGIVTDLSISENNQEMYYVISLAEVTGNGTDTFTFGDIYYAGKKVIFNADGYTVDALLDESTGVEDTTVKGLIQFYLYRNGSDSPTNQSRSAITVMQTDGLVYKWDANKTMTNCAFVILHLTYNQNANIRGLQETKFQITNSRKDTGDCFYDYLSNTVYGAAIPVAQINTTSLSELTAYSNELINYTTYDGDTATIKRFEFDGVLDTSQSIMNNLQSMADCCNCLIIYNEITAQWGVIVQKSSNTIVMDINDSNMASTISVTPMDIAGSYNVVECKFPDETNQDAFNVATFDLATIDPALLYPNEPVNKISVSLPLVNNSIRSQLIANRLLKSAREDLQLQVDTNFVGIQLEAGDIVTVTNANYGWVAKQFRIIKVIEQFNDDGSVYSKLSLSEFNGAVFDDVAITQFTPAPNTGIGLPNTFGNVPAPVVVSTVNNSDQPSITLSVTSSSAGISQYGEIWYSAYSNPTESQRIFGGTTAIQSNGNPYNINASMGNVTLLGIPAGSWYFFSRMVNSLATSNFSPASSVLVWQPYTVQFSQRYLVVAYADDAIGTGFSSSPRNKTYFGFANESSSSPITNPSLYTWLPADPVFGLTNFLLFINRGTRKVSFGTGPAGYASVTGSFVPTDTSIYDPSVWSGLPDGTNYIDLDFRTGQLIQTGTTTVGTGEIRVTNNPDGRVVAALAPLLNFGGKPTYTASVVDLTIDIYGRVLGFEAPDGFGYTMQQFSATSGQTVFTVTRDSTYLINNCWVFQNGSILDETEYTDTGGSTGTVTLDTGASIFDIITIVSFRSIQNPSGTVYNSFSRNTVDLVNASSYTASGFTLVNGYELLFLNGTLISDQDYDITGQTITGFPNLVNGKLTVLQWTPNNLDVPNGTPVNVLRNTVAGQDLYEFSYVADALNIYQNGVLLDYGTDYTAGFGEYTLSTVPTDANQLLLQQTFDRTTTA
jgi:hypothetical protein